ncbi:MAG TPA: hypothetical protein VEL72_01565, partial [Ktedonobacteraceae bacterium]|nr:hypothetical protein [Ktedonobacteraceae bacterium]
PANALRAELRQFANETITSPPERVVSTLRVRQTARSALRSGRMLGSTWKAILPTHCVLVLRTQAGC